MRKIMVSERNGILRGTTRGSIFLASGYSHWKGWEKDLLQGEGNNYGGKFEKGVLTQFALKYWKSILWKAAHFSSGVVPTLLVFTIQLKGKRQNTGVQRDVEEP